MSAAILPLETSIAEIEKLFFAFIGSKAAFEPSNSVIPVLV